MIDDHPRVSVLVPTRQRAVMLLQSLGSLARCAEPAGGYEVIVANDGDPSLSGADVVVMWEGQGGDPARLRYVRLAEHSGQTKTVNFAAKHARGDYIILQHDDDIAYPEKLRGPAAFLDAHADAEVVYTLCEYLREDGSPKSTPPQWAGWMMHHPTVTWDDVDMGDGLWVFATGVMYRRNLWEASGGWDEDLGAVPGYVNYGADEYEFHLRLLHDGAVFWALPLVTTGYRVHPGQSSFTRAARSRWRDLFRTKMEAKFALPPALPRGL